MGVDVNDDKAVDRWLTTPIKTNRDVLDLVRAHHVKVARPETMMMIAQLEHALKKIGDQVFHTQQELHFMASDNRQQQKNAAGLMLVTTGWPQGLKPEQRIFMIGWFLQNTPEGGAVDDQQRFVGRLGRPHLSAFAVLGSMSCSKILLLFLKANGFQL